MALDPFFLAISALTLISALILFLSRRLLHAVLALTFVFLGSALIFLYLGQTFAALLQLFIFVGGLSTYLIVAVASEESKSSLKLPTFILLVIIVVGGLSALLINSGLNSTPPASPNDFVASAGAALSTYYPFLFALLILLFSAVMGSILILRKFVKLII